MTHVSDMISPLNWLRADAIKSGHILTPDELERIRSGEKREDYIEPPSDSMRFFEWAESLTPQQAATAYFDFHERWTWETGTESDRLVFETLEFVCGSDFGNIMLKEGDIFWDSENGHVRVFDGKNWLIMIAKDD